MWLPFSSWEEQKRGEKNLPFPCLVAVAAVGEEPAGVEEQGGGGGASGMGERYMRRVSTEREKGNCNGKYDRMVNHHFALLISTPRGNRACFIQQFITFPSIPALNTKSSIAEGVY